MFFIRESKRTEKPKPISSEINLLQLNNGLDFGVHHSALIRHFLSSKLGYLSNYAFAQVIARSIGRDLSQNFCFAAKPSVTALPNALSDKEINYGESHSSSERELQSCPDRNPPSGGRAQIPRHV